MQCTTHAPHVGPIVLHKAEHSARVWTSLRSVPSRSSTSLIPMSGASNVLRSISGLRVGFTHVARPSLPIRCTFFELAPGAEAPSTCRSMLLSRTTGNHGSIARKHFPKRPPYAALRRSHVGSLYRARATLLRKSPTRPTLKRLFLIWKHTFLLQ